MLAENGVASKEDLREVTPSASRLARGPVAVIECFQRIPCDPCYHSCKQQAIEPFADINDRPRIDHDKCTGCGVCVSSCPGLAIFIIDRTDSETEAVVRIPYELLPIPKAGDMVAAVNRNGDVVGEAKVVRTQTGSRMNGTNVVWLAVPKELAMEVRFFRMKGVW